MVILRRHKSKYLLNETIYRDQGKRFFNREVCPTYLQNKLNFGSQMAESKDCTLTYCYSHCQRVHTEVTERKKLQINTSNRDFEHN